VGAAGCLTPTDMSRHKTFHILLVEDNETDVKIIMRAFQKNDLPCSVHTVHDGQDALKYLLHGELLRDKRKFPEPDIILLDVNLPRMDGHTFVREVRAIDGLKDIPIIIFTRKEELKKIFRYEGVNDYVVKSIDMVDLIKKIKEILSFKKEFFGD
jgi:CheY-like chemotaxis protein